MIVLGYVNPELSQDPSDNTWICDQGRRREFLAIQLGFIGTDFIIDSFVTIRLVQILNDGNRNAAEVNSIIGRKRKKRTLFTAVLYWNFFRLTIDFLYNGITVLNTVGINNIILDGLLCFATIAQSYLITVDAEIVKVIEGRTPTDEWPNNRFTGNGRNVGRSTFSPPLPVTSRVTRDVSFTPRYQRIVQSWTSPPSRHRSQYSPPSTWMSESPLRQQQTASFRLDKGKFVVVSMQRLTFFEWANIVTGIDIDQGPEMTGDLGGFDGLKLNSNNISGISIEGSSQRIADDRDTVELVNCDNSSFPELAHLSQSRRGSDTSTISNSSTQTKINDLHFVSDMNYKHSFI
ncbi:5375_t:CDS:1 [Acaulospora morrowiae]|uniref:5375_t:CDS:1 n=1 Tax=Acaulospora morrowiae TaxID=94023 RepID=A0A9N8W8S7_9GLOM|nr:5375_t:CDS:1 [Acaulospora morrowiae]